MTDNYYMSLALDLAQATLGQTAPNPSVAAIVVKNQQIFGIGAHLKAGTDHAEIHALKQAGLNSNGATLYVTLEPCVHYGKTPPCVDALIKAKIKKVVIATLDPNPKVAGKSIAILKTANIEVVYGIAEQRAQELNQIFFHQILYPTPFVTIKVGMSLDGKIATKDSQSKWITNSQSREDSHSYRSQHDAILVGINTVLTDDPSLTTRLKDVPKKNPIRIILDRKLRTPLTSKLIIDNQAPTWIITSNNNPNLHYSYTKLGTKLFFLKELDIYNCLILLKQNGINSLIVEGGEQIYASFLQAKLFNQIIAYLSPQLIGGNHAKQFFAGIGFADLTTNIHLRLKEIKQLGNDIKLVLTKKD